MVAAKPEFTLQPPDSPTHVLSDSPGSSNYCACAPTLRQVRIRKDQSPLIDLEPRSNGAADAREQRENEETHYYWLREMIGCWKKPEQGLWGGIPRKGGWD